MIQKPVLPKNWVAVGFSQDLEKGQINIVIIEELELVIWRDHKGQVHAWDNRCPHRGTRLSLGFVRGNQLACLYHGWQFGGDGQCVYTPSIPDSTPPKSLKAHTHRCVEFLGLIWVAPLDFEHKEIKGLKSHVRDSMDSQPVRSMIIYCSAENIFNRLASIPFPPSRIMSRRLRSISNMRLIRETESVFLWEDDENRTLASYQFREIQPGFIEFNCESEGTADVLLFALQKIDSQKTALHLLLAPENWSSDPISLKLAYAQWSKKLRNQLEQVS